MRPESGMQQAKREFQNRALARSRDSEQGFGFSKGELERYSAQNVIVFKREMHILEDDGRAGRTPAGGGSAIDGQSW